MREGFNFSYPYHIIYPFISCGYVGRQGNMGISSQDIEKG